MVKEKIDSVCLCLGLARETLQSLHKLKTTINAVLEARKQKAMDSNDFRHAEKFLQNALSLARAGNLEAATEEVDEAQYALQQAMKILFPKKKWSRR